MSVRANKRSVSEFEFYKKAVDIYTILARLLMNDKVIPKKFRYVHSVPTLNKAGQLIDEITYANTIYPYDDDMAKLKEEHQLQAIVILEQIFQRVQLAIWTVSPNIDKFSELAQLMVDEANLLRKWKKSTRDARNKIEKQSEEDKKIYREKHADEIAEFIDNFNDEFYGFVDWRTFYNPTTCKNEFTKKT